jgi:hypothetical protein
VNLFQELFAKDETSECHDTTAVPPEPSLPAVDNAVRLPWPCRCHGA